MDQCTKGAEPTSILQVSWAVKDINKVLESWSKIYGFVPWTYSENGGLDAKGRPRKIRIAFTYVGPLQLELVQCTEGRIFRSRFLDTWGEGPHHIGWYVDDVDEAVKGLTAQGSQTLCPRPG